MDQFARIVLGYHGCRTIESVEFSRALFDGSAKISDWKSSANDYDWLGEGIYFWEHGPDRAQNWAGEDGAVIGAVIQLGRCFDLTDIGFTAYLNGVYTSVSDFYRSAGIVMPTNRGRELKLRDLDCLVVNRAMQIMDQEISQEESKRAFRYQTVRCPFEEGEAAFPGSMFKTQTHIQISVRDPNCILGVFRPNI